MDTIAIYCKDCGALFYANARPVVADILDILKYSQRGHKVVIVDAATVRLELATCTCEIGRSAKLDKAARGASVGAIHAAAQAEEGLQPCGHPASAIRSSNPNTPSVTTNFCGWCADMDQARVARLDQGAVLAAIWIEAHAELARIEQHGGEAGFAGRILALLEKKPE